MMKWQPGKFQKSKIFQLTPVKKIKMTKDPNPNPSNNSN
jgi:hypothetical protein